MSRSEIRSNRTCESDLSWGSHQHRIAKPRAGEGGRLVENTEEKAGRQACSKTFFPRLSLAKKKESWKCQAGDLGLTGGRAVTVVDVSLCRGGESERRKRARWEEETQSSQAPFLFLAPPSRFSLAFFAENKFGNIINLRESGKEGKRKKTRVKPSHFR